MGGLFESINFIFQNSNNNKMMTKNLNRDLRGQARILEITKMSMKEDTEDAPYLIGQLHSSDSERKHVRRFGERNDHVGNYLLVKKDGPLVIN